MGNARETGPAPPPPMQKVRTFPLLPTLLAPAIPAAPSMSQEDALQTPRPVFQRRAARSAANSHRSGPQASHSDASLQIDRVPAAKNHQQLLRLLQGARCRKVAAL